MNRIRNLVAAMIAIGCAVGLFCTPTALAGVSFTAPIANALSVDPDADISVIFDTTMNPTTINNSSFVVYGSLHGQYQGTVSYDGLTQTAVFLSDTGFAAGEIVVVSLTTAMEEADATPLNPGFVWQFTVAVSDQGSGVFRSVGQYAVGTNPTDAVVADLDNDGDLDVACANFSDAYLSILINGGNGQFTAYPDLPTANQPISICAADFDLDGDQDLAAPGANNGSVSIHYNNGDGTFAPRTDIPTCGNQARGSAAADFDADGDIDLAIGHMSGCLAILFNDGAGGFGTIQTYSTHNDAHDLYIADFDGDGDLDLVASNKYTEDASVCFNDGAGGFTTRVDYPTGYHCLRVTAADLDADGDADFVAGSSDGTFVFWNQGDGSFPTHDTLILGYNPYSLTPGDLDGDQDIDLLASSSDLGVVWNHGMQNLEQEILVPDYESVDQSALADLDGDGDLDMVLTNRGSDYIEIMLNMHPLEPEITSIVDVGNDDGRQVRITWLGAQNDQVGAEPLVEAYALYRRIDANKLAGWDYVTMVPARGDGVYETVVPTLADSTADDGIVWSVFMVSSTTAIPQVFYDSAPDSGYSIDNLTPAAPCTVCVKYTAAGNTITWPENPETDVVAYHVYTTSGQTFDPGQLLAVVPGNSFLHTTFQPDEDAWDFFYWVSAADDSGNESLATLASPECSTDVIPDTPPIRCSLYSNVPNPFNPHTIIPFDLPNAMPISLKVYDMGGRLVDILLDNEIAQKGRNEVVWRGRNSSGRQMSSGTYFYRLEAGDYIETKRMTLLK